MSSYHPYKHEESSRTPPAPSGTKSNKASKRISAIRFVLAATEHLELELAKLEARRHALEDALAIAHAAESDEPHHLLVPQGDEDDEDEKEQGSVTPNPEPQMKTEDEVENLANTIGTLYVGSEGAVRFFGPSGGSEVRYLSLDDEFKAD
ncbi:hypothetical protein AAF712_003857 [Marasmius tenuissimus]|uniref:Uncharacterized protein n=1 Tax=Marasmius tenuissimus TaxID=585030 RepID=A0ABR3A736_9AGAR